MTAHDDSPFMSETREEVTRLLAEWQRGRDAGALDKLVPLVYEELRRVARRRLRAERTGHTLQTAALVNEAYLRLVDQQGATIQNRAHFLAIAAQLMRQILVDHARRRRAAKRGGGMAITIALDSIPVGPPDVDLLALHESLEQLAAIDPRQSRIVELRFFAGLDVEEIAEAIGVSPATVRRDWAMAKAWLYRRLSSESGS